MIRIPNRRNKSIIILAVHFGKMPWYFEYFIHSCKYNSTIDFCIITDDIYLKPLPKNVRVIFKTLADFSNLSTQKLGLEISLRHSYKICDFKPTFGLLFSDLIKNYDFWGQCDIDVIFGKIRNFFDDDLLEKFDFINVRHDYTTGCFYMFRNNSLMNNIFKRSRDYQKVLSTNTHFCFDECNFAHKLLLEGRSIFDIKTEIESFTHVIRSAERSKEIRAYFDFILIEGVPGRIQFNKGKIIYKKKIEAILYHLIYFKTLCNRKFIPNKISGKYYVTPTRIYNEVSKSI